MQFCIVSIVTVALGLAVVVQRAHVLLKTRLMLQHSLCAAWTDVAYVLTIASVINSLLGTVSPLPSSPFYTHLYVLCG